LDYQNTVKWVGFGVSNDESGNLYLAVKNEKKIEMKQVNIEEL